MRRLAIGLVALACHAALVAFLTWPLARDAASHLPATAYACRFDSLYSGWTLARQTAFLLGDPPGVRPGDDFHPATDTLFYGPTGFGALPYFAPVFALARNPTLALNAVFLLSVVLTALTLHLVVWRWTGSHLGGAVAACAFLLTRWTLWEWLPTTPHAAVLQYFPLIVLLAAEPSVAPARNLALLALVVLQCLTDLVYVAPAVLVPLAVLGAARLARPRTRRAGAILLGIVALGGLFLLVPAAGHLRVRAENPALEQQAYWPIDPDWFREHGTRIPSGLFARQAPTALPAAAFALIGAGALLRLSLRRSSRPRVSSPAGRGQVRGSDIGASTPKALRIVEELPMPSPSPLPEGEESNATTRGAWRSGTFWAGIGTLMSLTPTVRVGERAIDLPQAWLAGWVPLYGHIRTPSRLGVAALVGLALLAGLGFAECARRIAGLRVLGRAAPFTPLILAATAIAAMFAQYRAAIPAAQRSGSFAFYRVAPAIQPGGVSANQPRGASANQPRGVSANVADSPFLEHLRRPGGPLLELPARLQQRAWAPIWNARAMYRSIYHGRDVLNGYASYWPAGFPERMRLADRLPDRSALAELRRTTDLELVWVHAGELAAPLRRPWTELADGGGRDDLRLVARDGDDLLFAVEEERPR